jgi:putative endonuclease
MARRMARHLESGRLAEQAARSFLESHGLRLLASNYRCRYGELDLIMRDKEQLVVVEIRYRRHTRFMKPVESITRAKRHRIARATLHFMQNNHAYDDHPVRFDIIGISGPLERSTMNWIPGAFTAEDLGVG